MEKDEIHMSIKVLIEEEAFLGGGILPTMVKTEFLGGDVREPLLGDPLEMEDIGGNCGRISSVRRS